MKDKISNFCVKENILSCKDVSILFLSILNKGLNGHHVFLSFLLTRLAKSFFALQGQLGDQSSLRSEVTILANDDPYGKFVFPTTQRPIFVNESNQCM